MYQLGYFILNVFSDFLSHTIQENLRRELENDFKFRKVSLQERIGDYTEIETADLNPLPYNSTIRDCLQGTTSLQKSFSSFGHYFYPFQLEFSLSSFAPLRSLAMTAKESGEVKSGIIFRNTFISV